MTRIVWLLAMALALVVACEGASPGGTQPPTRTMTTTTPTTPVAGPTPTETSRATTVAVPAATPTATPVSLVGPGVDVGGVAFQVEVAITREERTKGLSGHPPLEPGTGMLFIFDKESRYRFWMIDMLFPLDMVWIDGRCRVVDVTHNAPPPVEGQASADLPVYSPVSPAQYVLEINGGEAASSGIKPGDSVVFTGELAGGC